jgi:rod shape-determining protein MreD
MGPMVRIPLVTIAALVLQASLFAELRVFGVAADLMLLLAVVAGIVGGPERGAIVGFVAGITFDLLLSTPFGMSALAYTLVGYAVGLAQSTVLKSSRWIPILTAAAGSAAGVFVYVLVAAAVGQTSLLEGRALTVAGVVGVLNGLISLAMIPAMRWALTGSERVEPWARTAL